jgi:hypothetical protein
VAIRDQVRHAPQNLIAEPSSDSGLDDLLCRIWLLDQGRWFYLEAARVSAGLQAAPPLDRTTVWPVIDSLDILPRRSTWNGIDFCAYVSDST